MPEELAQALEILKWIVAPAAGASLLVMLAVRLIGGEKLTPMAAALAVVAGLYAGNHFRGLMSELANFQHPTWQTLRATLAQALEREDGPIRLPQRHYWLPWLAGLAMLVELLVGWRLVPSSLAWIARGLVAFLAARLLTPEELRLKSPESAWLLGAAILLIWAVTTSLVRQWKDGIVGLVLLACFGAAILLMKQQSAGVTLAEMLVLCAAAFVGPALVVWKWPGDIGPAVAAASIILPSMLLLGYESNFEPYPPLRNFALIALAPLSIAPMLMPKMLGAIGLKRLLPSFLLPLIPLALAIYWILKETPLSFSDAAKVIQP